MNRFISALSLILLGAVVLGCQQQVSQPKVRATALSNAELNALVDAVPQQGPRVGNNYKAFFVVKRQNQAPAVNFQVEVYVKGKSEPRIIRTNERGLAQVDDLPFPSAKNPLVGIFHYYKGSEDQPRDITYPYLKSDAYRLKDVQYIPNTVTPDPA